MLSQYIIYRRNRDPKLDAMVVSFGGAHVRGCRQHELLFYASNMERTISAEALWPCQTTPKNISPQSGILDAAHWARNHICYHMNFENSNIMAPCAFGHIYQASPCSCPLQFG